MNNTIDLEKKLDLRKGMVLDLKKKKGMENQQAQVVFALDFSGSMSHLYGSGAVQELAERILPLGLAFDDNGEVDFYLFHHEKIKLPENITRQNVADYINKNVINRYQMGGTNYSPIINQIVKDFGGEVPENIPEKKGFFGKVFGSNKTVDNNKPKFDLPVYVIFITDGECMDKEEAEFAIKNASKYGIFFQFIGIGNSSFSFLEKLDNMSGRTVDNANFFKVQSISTKSDEELYALLLNEFPGWVGEAKRLQIIK